MWYDLNYRKLVMLLLPTFLRKPIIAALTQAMVEPIGDLHYQWKQKRLSNIYKLVHTGQRCYLRKALNDALDPDLRRIYLTKGDSFPRKYIYTRAEERPVFLGKIFIYQNAEYINTGVDFIVFAPLEIINNRIHELKALVEFYKLESKRYKIQAIYE